MSQLAHSSSQRSQRGLSTVAVSLVMLVVASLAVLFLNRSLIFEQRTSANYTRSTSALEVAEAGLEWATGMLNSPYDITTNCSALSTAAESFRKKYVFTNWGSGSTTFTWVATATSTVGCWMNGTSLSCSCPEPGNPTDLTTTVGSLPGFTVKFSAVTPYDPEAVQITSTGCTAMPTPTSAGCTDSTSSSADGRASVSVIIKLKRWLRAVPAAALTCGASCTVGGNFTIVNTDLATNGVLIDAGSGVTNANSSNYVTLPGIPLENAMVANDSSLYNLYNSDTTCSNDALFKAYFGATRAEYAAAPTVKTIACTSASDCGTAVQAAYADGWDSFYFPTGFWWNNSSGGDFGTPSKPVTMVSGAGFNINGNINIYGLLFSNTANFNDVGFGTANVYGAAITCGQYNNNATGLLKYDSNVLRGASADSGVFVRVPGSWKDF
jgi:Tfp pilus assembly protein PilX